MKILITGGAGFIGSHAVKMAIATGYQVVNVDCLTYAASKGSLDGLDNNPNYKFYALDIRNKNNLEQVVLDEKPEAIIHLAAESHVDRSIDAPEEFLTTNIFGTFNLLETCLKFWKSHGRKSSFRFLHVSTDEVFGSLGSTGKFSETTPYDPRSPYSASKASSDHLVRAWFHTFQLPVLLTNCSNNYGPYQFPEKLIPLTILNALDGNPLPIFGSGQNVRDWLFVEDHVGAILNVLKNGRIGESYNIGGNTEMTNLELVKRICNILDGRLPVSQSYTDLIKFVDDRPGHDARYAMDFSKITRDLGWSPSVTIDSGLQTTVDWYLENQNWLCELKTRDGVGKRLGSSN